ncbi:hypothetical protein, variant 1 [Aphanomyces invadans]|uniref:J domain-containing protein n=1 Tax=Aphanomyces invadans TaxID=157072 RepID=A0A024TTZ0_9STRA|nr:hypothetical protein, variant 1 [Aphanomyces invadans]ETV97101.1 hypothetical protein, variant 1 [Aphanomyces invadans]|eukprot:XP_008874347.1 hypothetical protein, variant 1 [Aphanomyces invadans]
MADLPPIWFDAAPDTDYYAALNVHRDASTEEIRRAFFVLSREFHPDKTAHRDDANQQYPRLDRAYKVLSSRPLRLAYDQYGERGVVALEEDKEVDDWSIANYAHPDEYVQERLRLLLRRWYEKQLEAPFSSQTDCEVEVDARDFVQHPMYSLKQLFNKQHRMIGISQMVMRQSTNIHVSRNTTVVVGGYLYDKHGLGLGALTCGINYVTADPGALRIHLNSEIGWTPKLSVHLEQPVSTLTSCFLMPETTVDGLDVTVGVHHVMRLLPHLAPLQGSMMLSANNGLSSSLMVHHDSYQSRATVAIRNQGPSVGLSVRKQMTPSSSAKVSMDVGVGGVALTMGSSGKVSRRSRLSLGLRFALQGISVRLGCACHRRAWIQSWVLQVCPRKRAIRRSGRGRPAVHCQRMEHVGRRDGAVFGRGRRWPSRETRPQAQRASGTAVCPCPTCVVPHGSAALRVVPANADGKTGGQEHSSGRRRQCPCGPVWPEPIDGTRLRRVIF